MVAQFPEIATTPLKRLTPSISAEVKTFTSFSPAIDSNNQPIPGGQATITRRYTILIQVTNIEKHLAVATFSRIFDYVKLIASNNVNPSSADDVESQVMLSVDSSEVVSVCDLSLKINKLSADYIDGYFDNTLAYLTNAIEVDLNPDE
ncbi:hypothetical protein [Nostoc sp. NMS8]|uniref:hypothetical protein n=1 Tax=Nostoc sp. NMS8 TaxID=2815392 RepID=UPI0025FA4819|nr:hypothetical protein [Nostoc sp. NMS8]MBN3957505.1 hypothetical protein [Nostoc sp. NMS8]